MPAVVRTVSVVTLLFVASACYAPAAVPTQSPPPPPVETPSLAPAAREDDCYESNEWIDGPSQTLDLLSHYAQRAVEAEVVEVGAGFFNTKDGNKPADPRSKPGNRPMVLTPVTLAVANTLRGDAAGSVLQVAIEGGSVADCYFYTVQGAPVVVKGEAYLLFLVDGKDADETRRPDRPEIMAAWQIVDVDTVRTPAEGDIPLVSLSDAIRAWPTKP